MTPAQVTSPLFVALHNIATECLPAMHTGEKEIRKNACDYEISSEIPPNPDASLLLACDCASQKEGTCFAFRRIAVLGLPRRQS
jgi:hypothetical protein